MKFFIHTMGCQMNEYDSVKMTGLLEAAGHERVESAETADTAILNTCHVREKAAHKVRSEIGRLARFKREKPGYVIGIAGCVAQAEGASLLRKSAPLDFAVGPSELHRIPDLVAAARAGARKQLADAIDRDPATAKRVRDNGTLPFFDPAVQPRRVKVSSFVTVMKGCDKMCAYCVVPFTRGMEESRPLEEIVDEVRRLAARGAREIVLVGQNVNGYRPARLAKPDFAALLYAVAAVPGVVRLRYTTSHPRHFDASLARAFAEIPSLAPYLHLPVQSGSDAVLAAMNRGYSAGEYREKIALARAHRPDLAVSSDFIVGFPGETDRDFAATLALVEELRPDMSYAFKYSPRPGTPAFALPDDVPEIEKDRRLAQLLDLCDSIARAGAACRAGQIESVLVEGRSKGNAALWYGRTGYNRPVNFESDRVQPGDLAAVEIERALPHSLTGRLVEVLAAANPADGAAVGAGLAAAAL